MLRPALRPYFALLLLLCLMRTLLPEAWILALHAHEHTLKEPAHAPRKQQPGKAFLSTKHTHCQAEQFYNVPFRPALPVVLPPPMLRRAYQPLAVPTTLACLVTVLRRTALRGPPRA